MAAAAGLLCVVAACGGGGGGSGSTPSTGGTSAPAPGVTTYPLRAAVQALAATGPTDDFQVTGDCNGTAKTVNGTPQAALFEGVNGVSVAHTATLSVPDCSTTVSTSASTTYYDANFAPLGSVTSEGIYAAVVGGALALPEKVQLGESHTIFTVYTSYADSTKTTRTGQVVEGFTIEADSASPNGDTVIYHGTSMNYAGTGTLLSTQQTYYRLGVDGKLTLLSLDIVSLNFGNTANPTSHLVYTRVP